MKFIKIYLLIFFMMNFMGLNVFASNAFNIQIQTDPSAQNIGPDSDFVHTILTVKDSSGKIVPNAYFKIHIHSPKKNAFISTDFPWVEDTHLMEYEGYLDNGKFQFDYIYPIRGKYRIDVYTGLQEGSSLEKHSLSLLIHENREELRNLLVGISLLLGFGIVAGFIIGKGARSKKKVFASLAILLSLNFIPYASSNAYADHAGNHLDVAPIHEIRSNDGINLEFEMNPGSGKVGMLNTMKFMAKNIKGQFIPDTIFDVKFWHIEDNKSVFSTRLFAKNGQAKLNFQFFDGAEYEIRVGAKNDLGEVKLSRTVKVEVIQPPMVTKIKTAFYFVMIVFIGILLGLFVQKKTYEFL